MIDNLTIEGSFIKGMLGKSKTLYRAILKGNIIFRRGNKNYMVRASKSIDIPIDEKDIPIITQYEQFIKAFIIDSVNISDKWKLVDNVIDNFGHPIGQTEIDLNKLLHE